MILVTSYINPDLDGVSSAIAMEEYLRLQGKEARAGFFGTPTFEARWLMKTFDMELPMNGADLLNEAISVLLVDTSTPLSIQDAFSPSLVTEIIDHHAHDPARDHFPNASQKQIELIGACATLVAERFKKSGFTPSVNSARLLFGGIVSNTINFQATNTTNRDRAMAEWLKSIAELPENFVEQMFIAKSDLSGDLLRQAIVDDGTVKPYNGHRVGFYQLEVAGMEALLAARGEEIQQILLQEQKEQTLEFAILNGIDILAGTTTLVALDETSSHMASAAFDRIFEKNTSKVNCVELRKQLMPKLHHFFDALQS